MKNYDEYKQWSIRTQSKILQWLEFHGKDLEQWIDDNQEEIVNWQVANKEICTGWKKQIENKIKRWIEDNEETEMVNLQELAYEKLQEYYKLNRRDFVDRIPHYKSWEKPQYGVLFPIFTKVENKITPFQYKERSVDYYIKEYAKQVYEKEFFEVGKQNEYNTYYGLLREVLCELPEVILFDICIDYRCKTKRKQGKTIRLYYDDYMIQENGGECDWIHNSRHKVSYGNDAKYCTKEQFVDLAKKKAEEKSSFPYEFDYKFINDELVLEENFKEIQRELIYNDKLKNYYKDEPNRDEKTYYYDEACGRIEKMYPEPTVFSGMSVYEQEEYVYIIEKITGINLAYCYTHYFTKIKEKLLGENVDGERAEAILLWVLDEFVDMPNVLARVQLVKEFMEPIIFLDKNVENKLCYLKEQLRKMKVSFNMQWGAIYSSSNIDNMMEFIEEIPFDMDDVIYYKETEKLPHIYAKYIYDDELGKGDFAIVFQHIIEKINFNYSIAKKILQKK